MKLLSISAIKLHNSFVVLKYGSKSRLIGGLDGAV